MQQRNLCKNGAKQSSTFREEVSSERDSSRKVPLMQLWEDGEIKGREIGKMPPTVGLKAAIGPASG
ncbi:hypothetical protein SDC9_180044 [bioreactor metagenome]|jgi:hypothetical protein|uniref:Uncharacterized protein n=1 Tax=bioreactor metagenome TaxID=1076179 RepID=A0A645H0J2_9ZZZZ